MIGQQSPLKVPVSAGWWKQHWRVPVVCIVLAGTIFAVFGQTRNHEFVNFDDNDYVYENPVVARGLTFRGIVWAFTHTDCNLYHPLTMLSLMGDYQLHGLHAGGYHFTNVLLHTASAILLFLVLRQMTGALWRSAFVAAVFAIHPLRVESVAWVAERKDVLSAFFFMLTLGAYVRYVGNPKSPARYLMVATAFVLALLCKPTVVMLPFVLLLLDYWPLHRFEPSGPVDPPKYCGIPRRLILEKIPLLALATGACAITVLVTRGVILPAVQVSVPSRIGNALVYYTTYLRQMIWPEGLAVPYPYPPNGFPPWEMALAGALLAGLSAVAWRGRRTQPWLLIGWLWYLGMLMPMIGIKPAGEFPQADRYTYLPQIGLYLAMTWLVAEWRVRWLQHGSFRVALGSLMIGIIAVLMVCAWKQAAYWKDDEILWNHTLACTTSNYLAHNNLGLALDQKGRTDEAITHFQEALEIKPDYALAHFNFGTTLLQKGRVDEAITHFQEALQIQPDFAATHNNLGLAFFHQGRMDEAMAQFQKALEIKPDDAKAHYNVGLYLGQKGRMDEAISQYQKALEIKPDYAEARYTLGLCLGQKGRMDEAISQFQQALAIKPDDAEARYNLGLCLGQKGRTDEAISQYQKALEIKPDDAEAHNNLGIALREKGRVDEAITQYQIALQIKPDYAEAQFNLGNALGQNGRLDDAITHYQEALQIKPDYAEAQFNLGNALLQKGRANVAVAYFQRALEINPNIAGIHLNLGLCFYRLGRMDEAIAQYQKALQIEPADSAALNDLAWLLATCPEASLRDGAKAVELARQANDLTGGENPVILHTLAAAFAEAGRFSEAVETAQRALRLADAQSKTALAGKLQSELKLYQAGRHSVP